MVTSHGLQGQPVRRSITVRFSKKIFAVLDVWLGRPYTVM